MENKTSQKNIAISLLPIGIAMLFLILSQIPFLLTTSICYGLFVMYFLPKGELVSDFDAEMQVNQNVMTWADLKEKEKRLCFLLIILFISSFGLYILLSI